MANQEGTLGFQDYAMMLQSAAFTTSSYTHGFNNKKYGGLGGVGRYLGGMHSDTMMARKLSGVTFMSRQYEKLATSNSRLSKVAPSLSHLLPSKYLAYWSAISGNANALPGMVAMEEIGAAKALNLASKTGPYSTGELFDKAAYSWRKSLRGEMYDSQISGMSKRTWGEALSQNSVGMKRARAAQETIMNKTLSQAARFEATQSMATRAGLNEGSLGSSITKFLGKKVAANPMGGWATAGKAIAPASRILGMGTAAVDLYAIGTFGGSMLEKGFMAAVNLPQSIYSGMTAGIHRGTFMSSGSLSPFVGQTGRQRAMANIYEKQLNLRQVLGNEAALLAGM